MGSFRKKGIFLCLILFFMASNCYSDKAIDRNNNKMINQLTYNLPINGELYLKTAGDKEDNWKLVTKTPANIDFVKGMEYWLVLYSPKDSDIEKVLHLANNKNIQSLSIRGVTNITDTAMKNIAKFRYIKSLTVYSSNITNAGVENLSYFNNLESLSLSSPKINDSAVTYINKLRLRKLSLVCENISDKGIQSLIRNNKQLEQFELFESNVSSNGIENIYMLDNLSQLALIDCKNITDDALEGIGNLKGLLKLHLDGCDKINGEGFKHLKNLMKLNTITLNYCINMKDVGLRYISKISTVNILSLQRCTNISDEGLQFISKMGKLNTLSLRECSKVTGDGISVLSKLNELKCLDISYCKQITWKDCTSLSKLVSLEVLRMSGINDISDSFGFLYNLRNIKKLYISSNNLNNGDIISITKIKNVKNRLEVFAFGDMNINDDILESIIKLRNLKTIIIIGTKITQEGINYIKQKLPKCEVELIR